jgi:PA domain
MMRRCFILAVLSTIACSPEPSAPAGPAAPAGKMASAAAEFPAINTDRMLQDIRKLSSDEFEGRLPGSKGETLTVNYLIDQLKAIGLEPGNPDGSWTQKVSLVSLKPQPQGAFVVKRGATKREFNINKDVVVTSKHVTDQVALENSELVFAGYGVQAPEYQWDDFKGMDVKGKTIIVLVNDPPVDEKTFGGKAMTYYGRWTYKYEKAAELGAAGVIIVHETEPAGYPFSVVQNNSSGRFAWRRPTRTWAGRASRAGSRSTRPPRSSRWRGRTIRS